MELNEGKPLLRTADGSGEISTPSAAISGSTDGQLVTRRNEQRLEEEREAEFEKSKVFEVLLEAESGCARSQPVDAIKWLPGGAKVPEVEEASSLARRRGLSAPIDDAVHFTVTGPAVVVPGSSYVLDVWAHLEAQRREILARAHEFQPGDLRVRTKGAFEIKLGTSLLVEIRIPGFVVDEPQDTIVWNGEATNASFCFAVPSGARPGERTGTVYLFADRLQIARLHFSFTVGAEVSEIGSLPVRQMRYRSAFASYAHEDRDEVLGRVQGMQKILPGLDVFLDVVTLRSGESWRRRLVEEILGRDVFYLFWSAAAKSSSWVETEWRAALERRGIDYIDPVPLASPEEVPPPAELAGELHFNDWVLAYRRGPPATG